MVRTHRNHKDGGDTLGRNIFVKCAAGDKVDIFIEEGTVECLNDHSTSLMGFLYDTKIGNVGFALSESSGYDNTLTTNDGKDIKLPFSKFDTVGDIATAKDINSGKVNEITCKIEGYYFISVTLIATPNKIANVFVSKNNEPYIGIYRSSDWQDDKKDTISRSAIVKCEENDKLSLMVRYPSAVGYSYDGTTVGSTFSGFLVGKIY